MGNILDWSFPDEIQEISSLSESLQAAFIEAARFRKTLETFLSVTDDFIYIKDVNHKFLYTSDTFARLTRHDSWRDLVGKDDFDIFPAEHAEVYFAYEKNVMLKGEKLIKHEEPYYDIDGNLRWVTSTKNPVFSDKGQVIGLVGISKDITDFKLQQERINYLATHDELTDLHNRRAFFELGQLMINQAYRDHAQLALLYIDLDNFKPVNDLYGHHVGDELLVYFASHLKKCARDSDIVVRIGGDEFAILIRTESSDKELSESLAKRILSIADNPNMRGCKCSVGIAETNGVYDLHKLLVSADKAMYIAKKNTSLNKKSVQLNPTL
ncbi:MAG: diguanylate cyclase domain-containing protein [Neptuniibacter sp.]